MPPHCRHTGYETSDALGRGGAAMTCVMMGRTKKGGEA